MSLNIASGFEDVYDYLEPFLDLTSEELQVARKLLEYKGNGKTAKAGELSRETGLQEGKVYLALKSLRRKGLVRLASIPRVRPQLFEPVNPKAIEYIVARFTSQVSPLTAKYARTYETGVGFFHRPRFDPLETRNDVYQKALELIKTHPESVFVISRRGAFYKWICEPETGIADSRDDVSRDLGRLLKRYLDNGGQILAFISGQSPIEEVKAIEKRYDKRFIPRFLGKDYLGVTALMCGDELILGWGPSGLHTTEGLYIESKGISDFIREIWSFGFNRTQAKQARLRRT